MWHKRAQEPWSDRNCKAMTRASSCPTDWGDKTNVRSTSNPKESHWEWKDNSNRSQSLRTYQFETCHSQPQVEIQTKPMHAHKCHWQSASEPNSAGLSETWWTHFNMHQTEEEKDVMARDGLSPPVMTKKRSLKSLSRITAARCWLPNTPLMSAFDFLQGIERKTSQETLPFRSKANNVHNTVLKVCKSPFWAQDTRNIWIGEQWLNEKIDQCFVSYHHNRAWRPQFGHWHHTNVCLILSTQEQDNEILKITKAVSSPNIPSETIFFGVLKPFGSRRWETTANLCSLDTNLIFKIDEYQEE
jgi:hypothetical protein